MRRKEEESKNLDQLVDGLKRWQASLEEQKAELNEFLAELLGKPNERNGRAS